MHIKTYSWDYTCGDGCCYNYGVDLTIDGVTYEDQTFSSIQEALEFVIINILGHTVENTSDPEEEEWGYK